MKKRLFISLVFAIALITLLSVSVSAKWWDENPFTDVKSDAWYYDAVRICNENDLFNGTSDTTFTPDMKMTRAMLAQVLANADGYDKAQYTGSSFSDVNANAWYASAVEWASKNGVTSGTGNGKFSPDTLISREQLATMLKRYAEYKGMDVKAEGELSSFADAGAVSAWAEDGLKWAAAQGVVKGADVDGTLYLKPQNTAARSECAQMLSNFLYIDPVYEINGNDLSLYKIVYNENEEGSEGSTLESAQYLAEAIKQTLGIELPVVNDTEVNEYEILVGRTAREDEGLVTIDRNAFEDDQVYVWSVQGNRLVIAGIDSYYRDAGDRSGKNVAGTRNAIFNFCERELGFYEYSDINDDEFVVCEPDPIISLDDGYYYKDMVWYRTRTFYMEGSVNGAGGYSKSVAGNISEWVTGDLGNSDLFHIQTPCMTDENNLALAIVNIRAYLEANEYISVVGVGINDTDAYCKCQNCMTVYRQYKARSATLALFVNSICEAFEEEYPEVKFQTGAYTYCQQPPVGITMHDNVMLEFFTVENCSGHAYDDMTCIVNKNLANNLKGWDEIVSGEIVVWDHTGGFIYFMTPQPDWDSMLENVRFFADANAREILMNSVFYGYELPNGKSPTLHADLGNIRAYMLSWIYMDPYMSEEEYYYRLDGCLKANYGDGWKYIREYIDIISELGNSKDHSFHAPPSGHFDYAEVSEKADYIDSLWEKAKALAQGEAYDRLVIHETSWIYLRQCATYEERYTNGTEEQRAEYVADNQYLLDSILNNRLHWTEGTLNPLDNLDVTVAPTSW